VQRFVSCRVDREKKLSDNAENNTAVASAGSNKLLSDDAAFEFFLQLVSYINYLFAYVVAAAAADDDDDDGCSRVMWSSSR